jgi:hypothetical protein
MERPMPPMGGKCFLLREKGIYCLERGEGTLIVAAVTHAGSGSLHFIDGVPDENGFFDATEDPTVGYEFYRASPCCMGTWMLNAGFKHGLTIRSVGGTAEVAPVASIVWLPFKRK